MQHLYCARRTVSDGRWGRGNRNLINKISLHDDIAVGKLLPQCFLRALCAYERAGVKNFTKKIVRQNSRVDATGTFELVVAEVYDTQLLKIFQPFRNLTCQKK